MVILTILVLIGQQQNYDYDCKEYVCVDEYDHDYNYHDYKYRHYFDYNFNDEMLYFYEHDF
jgi:hypothetical protein